MNLRDLLNIILKVAFIFLFVQSFTTFFMDLYSVLFMDVDIIKKIVSLSTITIFLLLAYYVLIYETDNIIKFLKINETVLTKEITFKDLDKTTLLQTLLIFVGVFMLVYNLPNFLYQTINYIKQILDSEAFMFNPYLWKLTGLSIFISLCIIKFSNPLTKILINKDESKNTPQQPL
ncbi:MAG: hypothetical protein H6578_10640 [Chitinophagales bacterium]|nr:hypothetical protein [Chitinophagales bacterium]